MAFRDLGELKISSANEMNVPVCCFLYEPDGGNSSWVWTAGNYCPRKNCVFESAFKIEADTKKNLLEIAKNCKCTLPFRGFVLVKPNGIIIGQTLASSKDEVRTQAVKEFKGFSAWNATKKKGWREVKRKVAG